MNISYNNGNVYNPQNVYDHVNTNVTIASNVLHQLQYKERFSYNRNTVRVSMIYKSISNSNTIALYCNRKLQLESSCLLPTISAPR
jgi:hypothetical protein